MERLNTENRRRIQNLEDQLRNENSVNQDLKENIELIEEEKNELFEIIRKGKVNNEDLLEQISILRGNNESEKEISTKTKNEL